MTNRDETWLFTRALSLDFSMKAKGVGIWKESQNGSSSWYFFFQPVALMTWFRSEIACSCQPAMARYRNTWKQKSASQVSPIRPSCFPYRHNALRIRRISEANLNLPSSPIPHLIFCGKNSIDTQDPSSYTPTVKKQYLIKKNKKKIKQRLAPFNH